MTGGDYETPYRDYVDTVLKTGTVLKIFESADEGDAASRLAATLIKRRYNTENLEDVNEEIEGAEKELAVLKAKRAELEAILKEYEAEIAELLKELK